MIWLFKDLFRRPQYGTSFNNSVNWLHPSEDHVAVEYAFVALTLPYNYGFIASILNTLLLENSWDTEYETIENATPKTVTSPTF